MSATYQNDHIDIIEIHYNFLNKPLFTILYNIFTEHSQKNHSECPYIQMIKDIKIAKTPYKRGELT